MMKQTLKKLGIMATAFMLALSSIAVTAQAATVPKPAVHSSKDGVMPIWDYVILISADMTISDSGWTDVHVYSACEYGEVNKIKIKIEVQRLENSSWKTVKTWTESRDSSSNIIEKETAVYKGYSYRLRVTTYAYYDNTLLEQVTENFNYGYYN